MATHVVPPFVDDSHLTILPVFPLNFKVPLAPAQTKVTGDEIIPPAGPGITVTVTVVDAEQPLAAIPVTV
jgi:hypothetical protein